LPIPFRYPLWASAALLLALHGTSACRTAEPEAADVHTAVEAAYAGDAACASCHGGMFASYKRSGMGRSVSLFDAAAAPERFDQPPVYDPNRNLHYEPFVRGDTLFQREYRMEGGQVVYERTHAVRWVIGSGHATRSYLMETGGHVTEMPLTWYVERGIWDLSPGYSQVNRRFSRPTNQTCITCHNALPDYSEFTQAHFAEMPLGISCERCHGPASGHVEAQLDGFASAELGVVNPADLDRGRQLAVCQQCHLAGTIVWMEGEGPDTFRPGQQLSENRVVYASREQIEDPASFGIASHAERLARSACFDQTQMTCTTCHDPHVPVAEMEPNHFNAVCQTCHAPDAMTTLAAHAATPPAELTQTCTSCHLQRAGTSDIPHVTFTDHWIRRTLPDAPPPAPGSANPYRDAPLELVRIVEEGEAEETGPMRRLHDALAYFEIYATKHRLPAYRPLVKSGVRAGLGAGLTPSDAYFALAWSLADEDSLAAAASVLEQGIARHPDDARLLHRLGWTLRTSGRAAEAVAPLRRAVAVQPHLIEAHHELAQALAASGRASEAEAAYRETLRRDPLHQPGAWNNLGLLLFRQQRTDEAASALDRALALDPDLLEALVTRGGLAVMQGQTDAAKRFLERALVVDPDHSGALANLGTIAGQAGDLEEARRRFEQAARADPSDARIRATLERLRAQTGGR
jgi:tetratricopeptide (TPR) repeat protein